MAFFWLDFHSFVMISSSIYCWLHKFTLGSISHRIFSTHIHHNGFGIIHLCYTFICQMPNCIIFFLSAIWLNPIFVDFSLGWCAYNAICIDVFIRCFSRNPPPHALCDISRQHFWALVKWNARRISTFVENVFCGISHKLFFLFLSLFRVIVYGSVSHQSVGRTVQTISEYKSSLNLLCTWELFSTGFLFSFYLLLCIGW